LFIAKIATVYGFNEWEDMEIWAREKEEWLRKYIKHKYWMRRKSLIQTYKDTGYILKRTIWLMW
jgi:hypothetical protein